MKMICEKAIFLVKMIPMLVSMSFIHVEYDQVIWRTWEKLFDTRLITIMNLWHNNLMQLLFDVLLLFNNAVYFMNPPFRKRKVREIEEKNRPADNEKWKNKGKMSYKRAKQRRL